MKQAKLATVMAFLVAAALGAAARASAPLPPPAQAAEIPIVLLIDSGAGQTLLAHQAQRRFPPASLTKVMTAYVALERIAAGELRPDQTFTVSAATYRAWKDRGSTMDLRDGEQVPVDALLHGIAAVSANNAAVVLAEGAAGGVAQWTALMNAQARRLGMGCSRFATPNGWPDGGRTYTCAQDMAKLGAALIDRHPDGYRRYFGQSAFAWNGATGLNRNPLLGAVAGADGIKTGHTREAGYNLLGSAERDGRRLILVLAGASSEAQRASAARALIEWGFAAWRSRTLFDRGERIGSARVQGGDARSLPLAPARDVRFATRNPDDRLSASIVYQGPLAAPIARGAQVATLRIVSAAGLSAEVPLMAAASVGKAGPVDRILNGIAAWFG